MLVKCGNTDITNKVLSLTKKGAFADNKFIGQVPSFQLDLKLDNRSGYFDDKLNEVFYYTEGTSTKEYVYVVYEKPEKYTKELTLKLYDRSYELDVPYLTELNYTETDVTISMQLDEMEQLTGFKFNRVNIPEFVLNRLVKWYDNTITIRSYLSMIAELFGANVFSTDITTFSFIPISKEVKHKTSIVSNFEKGELYNLTRVCFDNSVLKAEKGNKEGNTLFISPNNYYVEDDNKQEIIDYIYSTLNGLSIISLTKFSTRNLIDLNLGDIVNYNDEFNAMILDISSKAVSSTSVSQELVGEMISKNEEIQINKISPQTKMRLLKVEFDQEKLKWGVTASEVKNNIEKIGKLELSNTEMKQSLSSMEEKINKIDISNVQVLMETSATVLNIDNPSITLSAKVMMNNEDKTSDYNDLSFSFIRTSKDVEADTEWNTAHQGIKEVTITIDDVKSSANFRLEAKLEIGEYATSNITILDETDNVLLAGQLISNQPQFQTKNNEGNLSPAWDPLIITPGITNGMLAVDLDDPDLIITWKRQEMNGEETDLQDGETVEGNILTVIGDKLSGKVPILSYIAYVNYRGTLGKYFISFGLAENGKPGIDGIGIISTHEEWAIGDSNTVSPMSGWVSTRPVYSPDKYLWQRIILTYTNNTSFTTDAVCVTGDKGKPGKDAAVKSNTVPSDKEQLWLDTSVTPNVLKQWDGFAWVQVNDPADVIDGAVGSVNESIKKTNDRIDTIDSSIQKIEETTEKTTEELSAVHSELLTLKATQDSWQVSIDKINELKTDDWVLKDELKVYLRFTESSGQPLLELGTSKSETLTQIKNDGMYVLVNGTVTSKFNANGAEIPRIYTKEIFMDGFRIAVNNGFSIS